jgi:hypothetical protein
MREPQGKQSFSIMGKCVPVPWIREVISLESQRVGKILQKKPIGMGLTNRKVRVQRVLPTVFACKPALAQPGGMGKRVPYSLKLPIGVIVLPSFRDGTPSFSASWSEPWRGY